MDNTGTPVLYIVGNYNIDLVMGNPAPTGPRRELR